MRDQTGLVETEQQMRVPYIEIIADSEENW
jgi:hypothetical protein